MKKNPKNPFDWFSALCIFVLFLLASARLGLTDWADHLDVVGWLLLFGAVVGYILGRWRVHWLLITLFSIISSVILFGFSFIYLLSEKAGFLPRILDLWERLNATTAQLAGSQPVTDSILFLLVVGALFWIVGISTGISIMRSGKPWIPLVLLGFGVLVIEHYQPDPRRAFYSWAFAVVLIILLGRTVFLRLRRVINDSEENVGNETEFDFMRGVLTIGLITGFAALLLPRVVHIFVTPTVSQTSFTKKWEQFTQKFENAFFALDQNQLSQEDQIADDFSLGTGQILGDEPVLYIQTSTNNSTNYPFYWRGKVYSTYFNKIWSIGNSYKQVYHPLEKITSKKPGDSQISMKVWVQSLLPELNQVYTTGEVTSFSRSVDAAIATESIYDKEVMGYFMDPGLKEKEIYRFDTVLSLPTSEQLRTAGTDYPDWVIERYLQFPEGISDRMVTLSHQITSGMTTPFDITVAVTQYLRTNFEYQGVIPTPPKKTDPVEWFLFDYKKGFCNYFASAEVLLLRLSGVPARLAVGYAQGMLAETGDSFTVQQNDSHAWPEVYFPGYGWIPFEPTPALANLDWVPSSASSTGNIDISTGSLEQQLERNSTGFTGEDRANLLLEQMETGTGGNHPLPRKLSLFGIIMVSLAGLLVSFAALFLGIKAGKNWKVFKRSIREKFAVLMKRVYQIPLFGFWIQTMGLTPVERNFSVIEFSLRLLGEKIGRGNTARELAALLVNHIPTLEKEVVLLLEEYQLQTYSKHTVNSLLGKSVSKKILKTSIKFWWDDKMRRFSKATERFR
jgi:hypothetical protein